MLLTPGVRHHHHLFYAQYITSVTLSAVVQAPVPHTLQVDYFPPPPPPPPGYAVLAPPDFKYLKSSPLDFPPVSVGVPVTPVPARGSAAASSVPPSQVALEPVALAAAAAPSWVGDLSAVLRKLAKRKSKKKRKVSSSSSAASSSSSEAPQLKKKKVILPPLGSLTQGLLRACRIIPVRRVGLPPVLPFPREWELPLLPQGRERRGTVEVPAVAGTSAPSSRGSTSGPGTISGSR
ncbi:protein shank-like [Macrobrachium nipponense]|uniref:protein shank-like n=1 Tax=Macrobrachium nipponense TaxID=159736 RepID=UPI0030C88815